MTNSTKPTSAYWIISVLALLWYAMGVIAYLGQAYISDANFAKLSEGDQVYYENVPAWVTAVFAISVFIGALGCVSLLFRKKWAFSLFLLSLITVIVQFVYNFFIQEFKEIVGTDMIWSVVVIAIALFLVWYSKKSTSNGWIS